MVNQATDGDRLNAEIFMLCFSENEPNVDGWLVVKACYVLRVQTQVKPGTRILYYCIVKLLLCARETQRK